MQKNLTKVLSLVLALVMVLGLLPISALANEVQVASSDLPTAIDGLSIAYPYNTETVQLTGTVPNRFSALTFESARNEVESAQMVLTPNFQVDSFELTMDHLFNEKGNIIPASAFEVYTQHYVTVSGSGNSPDFGDFETLDSWFLNKKYIEDVFHPREGNEAWDGVYPDALIPQEEAIAAGENTIAAGKNQGIWVNLNVGDAAPGTYTGSAKLTVNGTAMQIPVSIRVYDVTLPEEIHMTTSMGIWWDQLEAGEGDMSKKLGDLYYDYLVSKRIAPWSSYGDWYETDPLIESIVEKAADPTISSYLLYYYADGKVVNRESLVTTLSALINKNLELANAGNNIDLFEKAYFYFTCVDEPAGGSKAPTYAEVQVCIDILDDVKTELAPMLDAYPELKASFLGIKNMVTGPNPNDDTFYMKGCADYSNHEPLTSIYNSVLYTPQFHHMQTQEQRDMYANDEEVWWYGCCHPVAPYPTFHYNTPLVNNRAIGWMMYDYDFAGMLYSCVNYWGQYVDNGISLFDYWNGYGSGTPGDQILVYPGSDYGIEGPIGSMRVETIRESSEDYEYLWMLENQYGISDLSVYTNGLYDGAIVTGVYDGQAVDPDGDSNTDAAALHHTRRVAMLTKLETLSVAANGATEIEPGQENFVRGQEFKASVGLNVDFEDANYGTVSFEYKLTSEGKMAVILRSPGHVPYYGVYYFTANGAETDYAGITTKKLADGYILVTCDVAALNRTNNNDNRDNAPVQLAFLDIYDWSTADGYIDNVKVSMDAPEQIPEETEPEVTEPEVTEPEVTEPENRGERFEAGIGLPSRYLSNVNGDEIAPIATLSFDYKLDDEATGDTSKKLSLILRRASSGNWTNAYVDYTFVYEGVRYNPANVTSEILEDGYVHVEIDMTALEYDDYGVFDVYSWTSVGGYIDNIAVTLKPFASIYSNGEKLGEYTDLASAIAAYETGVIVLEDDVTEDIVINSDLYLDLNGKTLTGNVSGEGMLYGMDSANDSYDASACGRINGTISCAVASNCKNADNAKRYVAFADENGYTFHRFYAGITKQSLAPAVTGVGYKAEFYADETVLALVDSIGYNLWLEGGNVVSRSADFKNELTLRVKNYDIANYGETNLYACASITIDGEKIVSSEYSLTMRQVVESVNAYWERYTKEQKIAAQDMVKANESAMTGWDIANILAWSPIEYRGERFEAGVDLTKTLSNVNGAEITPIGTISFDYKLDEEANGNKDKTFGLILRRASDGNWTNAYESYTFKYEGTRYSYDNITTEILEDGYIHVEIDLTGFEYDDYGVFSIYGSWTNIGGYIDNIQWTEAPVKMRGERFEAGVDLTKTLSNVNGAEITPIGTISFDYKLDEEANGNKDKTFSLILRRASDGNWTNAYEDYTFAYTGTRYSHDNITTETLEDGYIHVEIDLTGFEYDDYGVFSIYGSWTNVGGYIDNIQWTEAPVKMRGERFESGVGLTKELSNVNGGVITPIGTLSFDYKLDDVAAGDKNQTMGLILRRASEGNWTDSYQNFTFKYEGTRYSYDNVTAETLEDGYIRVTIDLTGYEYNDYGVFDIYDSWTNVGGYIDNIQWTEAPVKMRGERFEAGVDLTKTLSNVNGAEITPIGTISFDYKLDEEAAGDTSKKMSVILRRASDGNWTNAYEDYTFIAEGVRYSPANITCQTLEDGYIHVEIDLTGFEFDDYGVFSIYGSWTTVGGYVDNIQWEEPVEKPELVIRGNAFVAGSSTENQITRVAYSKIVFDYVLPDGGTMDIRLRCNTYNNYYGQFTFNATGESTDYAGVTTEVLADGYVRVTINVAEVTLHTSAMPEVTANIQVYKTTTGAGYLEIIELVEA